MKIFSKNKKTQENKQPLKVNAGIAFGGGGTRGFAHIGVIRAFEECGIEFAYTAGTSAGAIAASCYAAGMTSNDMEELIKDLKIRDIRNSRVFFIASDSYNIEKLMQKAFDDTTFEELKKPLAVVAVDLKSGDEVVIKNGKIAKAVSASCAVPGIFTPVEYGFYNLVDGGLANPVPADILRGMGAEKVVSVDLNPARGNGTDSKKFLDVIFATFRIAMKATAIRGIVNSDIIIQPDLAKFKATSPQGSDDMIKAGYDAAMESMDQIRELLKIPASYIKKNVEKED